MACVWERGWRGRGKAAWQLVWLAVLALAGLGRAYAAGDIHGVVRDEAALPISSVWVDAYDLLNARIDSGLTDATGAYAITNLPSGTYYLLTEVTVGNYVDEWYSNVVAVSAEIPAGATPVVVAVGAVSNINFFLAAGGSISGRVSTVTNSPLANVWVDAYDAAVSRRGSALTDASGAYVIAGLPEESFYVRTDAIGYAVADEWFDNVPVAGGGIGVGARTVAVQAGAVTGGVNFALAPGAQLAGRVTTTGGAPLGSVWVDAYLADGTLVDSGLTGTNGAYAVTGLPAGTYYARTFVGAANFANEWYDDVAVLGFDVPTAAAQALVLATGGALTNVNFALAAGGGIAGAVTNDTGAGLSGAWVDVYLADETWVNSVQAGSGGVYAAGGLAAGTYYVRTFVGATNLIDEWYDNEPVTGGGIPAGADGVAVATGLVTTAIHFGLRAGGTVAGQVTRTNGVPLSGITVSAFDAATNWIKSTSTDAGGLYQVQGLPAPAGYYVLAESDALNLVDTWYDDQPAMGSGIPAGATPVAVSAGGTTGGIAFALADGGTVAGHVMGVGGTTAVAGVTVALYDGQSNRVYTAETQGDGTYTVSGVAAGAYRVRTEASALNYADMWWPQVPAVGFGIPVAAGTLTVAAGGSVTGVTFTLSAGATLSGRVTDSAPAALSSVGVDAYDAQTNWLRSVVTDSAGDYTMPGLPTQHLVYARTYVGTANYVDEWYDDVPIIEDGIDGGAQGVNLAGTGSVSGVDFALAAGGIVAGSVGDVASSPLVGVGVALYSSAGDLRAAATTDGLGAYALPQLPAAAYYVRTGVGELGFQDEWFDDQPVDGEAVPAGAALVSALPGETTNVSFALDFTIMQVGVTNGEARVLWQAASGTAYRVEQSADLLSGTWTNAPSGSNSLEQSAQTAVGQMVLEYRNPVPVDSNACYRVRVEL